MLVEVKMNVLLPRLVFREDEAAAFAFAGGATSVAANLLLLSGCSVAPAFSRAQRFRTWGLKLGVMIVALVVVVVVDVDLSLSAQLDPFHSVGVYVHTATGVENHPSVSVRYMQCSMCTLAVLRSQI